MALTKRRAKVKITINQFMHRPLFSRYDEVQRLRKHLERTSSPRFQMFSIVLITGLSGFVTSFLLHHAGFNQMWSRYLLAFALAYLVFLFLLWVWIKSRDGQSGDIPDLPGLDFPSGSSKSPLETSGNGGEFGGGGASQSFDFPGYSDPIVSSSSGGNILGDALEGAASADELAIPLIVIIAVLIAASSLFVLSFYFVYSAPVFFAEILVDSLLAAGLYKRLQHMEDNHWLTTAITQTFWPFLLTALMAALAGKLMVHFVPGAESIGDILFRQ